MCVGRVESSQSAWLIKALGPEVCPEVGILSVSFPRELQPGFHVPRIHPEPNPFPHTEAVIGDFSAFLQHPRGRLNVALGPL